MSNVKIITSTKAKRLQDEINDFLSDVKVRLVDIKFTQAVAPPYYSAMVIYD